MDIHKRLKELNLALPEPLKPVGTYTPALVTGNLLYLSGILPFKGDHLLYQGRVGKDITLEEAQQAAKQIVLNALSIIEHTVGLEKINRCIRLNGYVASSDDFYNHPLVLNTASELINSVFGQNGIHTRVAVGVFNLPLNSPVEIDFIFEIKD